MCDSRPTTLNGSDPAGGRFLLYGTGERVRYVMLHPLRPRGGVVEPKQFGLHNGLAGARAARTR